jgi:hypothetical protein
VFAVQGKQPIAQIVRFKQMPESAHRGVIRHRPTMRRFAKLFEALVGESNGRTTPIIFMPAFLPLQVLHLALNAVPLIGVRQRGLFFGDYGPLSGEFYIQCNKLLLIDGHIVFREYRIGRACRHTDVTVDALVRVDDEKVWTLMKGFNGADINTIGVFAPDTVFGNDISHPDAPESIAWQQVRSPGKVVSVRPGFHHYLGLYQVPSLQDAR